MKGFGTAAVVCGEMDLWQVEETLSSFLVYLKIFQSIARSPITCQITHLSADSGYLKIRFRLPVPDLSLVFFWYKLLF